MKDVISALRKQRKTHTSALKQIDAMLKRAGVSEGKAKRRRRATTKTAKPPTTTPAAASAAPVKAKPPIKALRGALKANARKSASTPTPANGKSKSGDLFSDD